MTRTLQLIAMIEDVMVSKGKISKTPVSYSINPSSKESVLRDLVQDASLDFKKNPIARFIYNSKTEDLYVWPASEHTHPSFWGNLGLSPFDLFEIGWRGYYDLKGNEYYVVTPNEGRPEEKEIPKKLKNFLRSGKRVFHILDY
jgi:hypothetical protein